MEGGVRGMEVCRRGNMSQVGWWMGCGQCTRGWLR